MHDLALCVVNDGTHYDARVKNGREMTARHYRNYIHRLVCAAAHDQRVKFGVRSMSKDINQAVDDVLDYMQDHMVTLVEGPDDRKLDESKDDWLRRVYG